MSRARFGYAGVVGLLASVAMIAAVWSLEPRFRAIGGLSLAGTTLPSDRQLDAASFGSDYVRSMHERAMASLPGQPNAEVTVVEVATDPLVEGQPASIAIEFEIVVEDADPQRAERSVARIEDAFVAAHRQAVTMPAVPADELEAAHRETAEATEEIERLELNLSEFEQINAAALPGFEELDAQASQQAEAQRTELDQKINMLEARRTELDRALNEMQRGAGQFSASDSRPLTSEILGAAQARWAILRGRFGADSPEAVELGTAIAQAQATVDAQLGTLVMELDNVTAEYERAQKKYPLDHPDVVGLAHRVSALERNVEQARVVGLSNRDRAYIESLARERVEIDGEIAQSKDLLAAVETNLTDYKLRAERAPQIQQEHVALQAQVADAKQRSERATVRYAELQANLEASRLETAGVLSVADEVRIERVILSWPAMAAGLGALLGLPAFLFTLDLFQRPRHRTVTGGKLIARLQGCPPLAEIPDFGGA
jgi:hypothetical protein